MSPVGSHAGGSRLVGLDLFRSVAIVGMLVAHVGPSAWTAGDGLGTVHWQWEIFHSRMPAMFAFAAGLSLNLGEPRSATGPSQVGPALIRAAQLVVCGVALSALHTPVAVILASFALWFLLVLPFRGWSARSLLVLAAGWGVVGPLASWVVRRFLTVDGGIAWGALVQGDYPALTWMPFVLAGLAVGRLDLRTPLVRRRLALAGAGVAALAYGGSTLFLALGGAPLLARFVSPEAGADTAQRFAAEFFSERGYTSTSTWLWLLAPAPHSGSWADVFGCLGVCLVLLACLLPLGSSLSAWRCSPLALQRFVAGTLGAVASLGSMVLSVYAVHIVAMFAITALTGHSFQGPQSVLMLAGFVLGAVVFAALWSRVSRRGPLEWLLARTSTLIERTGRRVSAGWTRR